MAISVGIVEQVHENVVGLGVPCEVYSRIVGYLRPVQNWNAGKRQEFKERQTYKVRNLT